MTKKALQEKIIQTLKQVYDPEIPAVSVYDLGLIYDILCNPSKKSVAILMTLTSPNCPAAETIPADIKKALLALPAITEVDIALTFSPPYDPKKCMTEDAKLILGWP